MPVTEQDKVIGARIRSFRTQAGMSQGDLGAELNVTFQQIQKYEKGSNRVSGSNLIKLCKVLHTTPDILLGVNKANGKTISSTALDLLDDVYVRKVLEALHALPDKKREGVAKAMMALVGSFS